MKEIPTHFAHVRFRTRCAIYFI